MLPRIASSGVIDTCEPISPATRYLPISYLLLYLVLSLVAAGIFSCIFLSFLAFITSVSTPTGLKGEATVNSPISLTTVPSPDVLGLTTPILEPVSGSTFVFI